MRTGKRACPVEFWKKGLITDAFGDQTGEVLWRTLWGDMTAERGTELTISGERDVQTYLWVSFDYLDLCEGTPPRMVSPQALASMRLVHDGHDFDVDSIKPDYITRRDVVIRLVQKTSGN